MRKRVLSLLLAICLVVGLLPPSALAVEPSVETPTEVVLEMYAGPSSDFDHITWTAAANAVFYATTDSNGRVTDITSTYVDDATTPWNIKLDNTKTVAELTLKDAYIYQASTTSTAGYTYGGVALPKVLNVSGTGALKIIVDGAADSKILVGYSSAVGLNMGGTTTITSVSNRKLTIESTGSGGFYSLTSDGDLILDNANLEVSSKSALKWGGSAITAKKNMTVMGGTLAVESKGYSASGIQVTNTLSIKDNANVTVEQTGSITAVSVMRSPAYGITAAAIEMGPAFLEIKDHYGYWNRAHTSDLDSPLQNKLITSLPTFVGVTAPDRMVSLYSTEADGTGAQLLDPTDANALLYSYLCFRLECNSHEYDEGYTDADCNKCGAIRELPKNVTVSFAGNSTNGYAATWTAAPGEVYYATATAGAVNSLGALTTEPAEWNIKLDNTKAVAELTLKNVSLTVAKANNATTDAITVSGDGALKIIVDGTSDSTLATGYGSVLRLMMGGTTTITSVNNRKLTLSPNGTGNWIGLESTGDVVLENANVVASANTKSNYNLGRAIQVATNLTVKGSTLQVNPGNVSGNGIWVTNKLTITNGAKVTVNKTSSGIYAGNKVSADTTIELYGVYAGSVDFGGGSFVITDTAAVAPPAEYSVKDGYTDKKLNYINNVINVVPDTTTLVNANDQVIIKVGNNADGSDAAAPSVELNADNIKSYRYVSFQLVCGNGNHIYTDSTDPDCNNCGETREIPKNLTVTLSSSITWNATAGEIYYATTDASGVVSNLGALTAEPAEWNIRLDNTKVAAELTLKGATIKPGSVTAFTASGDGALKIIVDGESTIQTGAAPTLTLAMAGGTTITSVNNSKLSVSTTSTSIYTPFTVTAGSLTFQNANMYLSAKNRNSAWPANALDATGLDVTIAGGTFMIDAFNMGVNAISAGSLTIKEYAKVTAVHSTIEANDGYSHIDANALAAKRMYGINVSGNFVINNASLTLINENVGTDKGSWIYTVNKMPTIVGDVLAKYSTSDDGSNLQELNPADASANIEYPYVSFAYNCLLHEYDNANDPDCNKCGATRYVPRPLTVIFGNYVTNMTDKEVVWNAAVGEIYYAKTDASGVITDLGALTTEPSEWNIKLDNTQATAVLTLKNATIVKEGDQGFSNSHNGIKAVGEGMLQIVVDGNSTIQSGYNNAIVTDMAGGTTYTSLNDSLLTVQQKGTSGISAIRETASTLTFENANILATHSRYATVWTNPTISAAGDMNVIGSKLNVFVECASPTSKVAFGSTGISVGGVLTLSNYSVVNVAQKATGADEFQGGIDYRPTSPQYRYGVMAGDIVINDSSLYIVDNSEDMFEYAINKIPTVSSTVASYYSTNLDGSDLQTLTSANTQEFAGGPHAATAAVEFPYVAFTLICNNHEYDNDADPDCNKCGAIREVPRTITVRVTTGNAGGTVVDLTKTIVAGEVYYGVADTTGLVTSFETATTAPADWDFKLDNTKPVAELVFNNAYLYQGGEVRDANGPIGMFSISGEGALKIITETASTLECGYGDVIETAMVGGTTYTSTNNSLLTLLQKGTGGTSNIIETVGSLTFENANIYGSNKRQGSWSNFMVSGAGNVTFNGGALLMEAINCAVEGIYAGGNLVINNYAKVNLMHASSAANTFTATEARPRHAVEVGGNIAIENASLKIQDVSDKWEVAVNKMPALIGVNAVYSANVDGSNTSVLNPTDPSAKIEYPYVAFIYNCTSHEYDNDADFDCNKCGEVREVPRSVTVVFGNYVKDVINQEVVWDAVAGQVYYAKTNDEGVLTSLGALTAEPAEWNIKLDNTQPTAVLTLKNATLVKETENGYSNTHHGIQVTGEGKLKIVVAGDSTITSGYNNPITTNMAGGTTYTSVNNSLLTLSQNGTSGVNAIKESEGNLTFDHANILAIHSRYATVWSWPAISAAGDMAVIGGKLDVRIQDKGRVAHGSNGIDVSGVLTLSDYALVRVQHNSIGADGFTGGIDNRPTSPQYRYGVKAGDIVINNASLYITDNVGDMFEYAINKMPTLVGDVAAYYSVDTDGSNLQTLTAQNATEFPYGPAAAIEFPYVAFALICNNHEYDNNSDPECNKCGAIRDIIRDVTIQIVTDDKKTQTTPLAPEYNRIVNVAAGEVYYGITNANGYVTEFVKKASEPAEWNIKLDNTKPVAELVFKDAFLYKYGTYRTDSAILNLLTVSGEGKLKVITQSASILESYYGNVIETKMAGGTTYTSVNNALLTLRQYGTSGLHTIAASAGVLTFENANIHALNKRQGTYKQQIISAASDMNVIGGNLLVEAVNCSTQGIVVSGKLNLTNYASVRLINEKTNVSDYKPDKQGPRYAVTAVGDIIINEASLRISDAMNHWDVALNKSPKLTGVTAKYSEKADGSNLQALNPADPTAAIEYPYVEYVVNCAEHIWDNATDPNCNRCGEIRAVPYDIQVAFQYGITELLTVAWDAKVGEIYYATTSADGSVVDLGKLNSEPAKWNIKLDNTGAEAVLTFNGATITRKKRPTDENKVFDIGAGTLGTITIRGKGALRVVTEKASTITTDEAFGSIVTSMDGGTTYESKNSAKLTLTGTNTAVCGGVQESVGSLTFVNANMLIKTQKTHQKYGIVTVSTPRNMTVIGGKVEINASNYANSALNVKGDLLVKDNGILIVSTGSKAGGGSCQTTPYGMNVAGDITVDNATLMVKNYGKYWGYMLNKMPTLLNGVASYSSAKSTKESKLTAFTMEAGTDMTELEEDAIFYYFSNSAPGTLDTSLPGEDEIEEEEEEDDFLFDDTDNPFTGDTVNLTLLFALVLSSAAALVVLFSKKKVFRE